MKVTVKHATPLHIAASAIRTCWASQGKSDTEPYKVDYALDDPADFHLDGKILACGPNDKALIDRVGNKFKHASTLEHLNYTFFIEDVSRALLQEIARHRLASYSVKSTRYTLKELKLEERPIFNSPDSFPTINREVFDTYLVVTGDDEVDFSSALALVSLQDNLKAGKANDKAKYCLPEAYKTSLTWTINARALQNFLSLRTTPSALWEIRDLANLVYSKIPADHQYLFKDSLYDENKVTVTMTKQEHIVYLTTLKDSNV